MTNATITKFTFTLDDLNKFAPDGIVFETSRHKLENGKIKDFIYVVPTEYKKKYPNIERANNFTYTSYSLDDLDIFVDNSEIANADSKIELTSSVIKNKGNNFGAGDWPFKANKNLFSITGLGNQQPIIDWSIMDSYGKNAELHFDTSSELSVADNEFRNHDKIETPKKSIFNSKNKKYIAEWGILRDKKVDLETKRDQLHKKSNELHSKLINEFNADAILAYAYRAATDEKIAQKFQSKDKFKASVERLERLGVKPGKKSGVVHNENLIGVKKAMVESPYKPIIIDKSADAQFNDMAKKVRDKKVIIPEENKRFIKTFFDKEYY